MTRMNYSLEEKAVELLRESLEAIKASEHDQRDRAAVAKSVEALGRHQSNADFLAELRERIETLLDKILEDAQEQAALEEYRIAAMAKQKSGEIEVDDGAIVSLSDQPGCHGAYVAAWLWVYASEAGIPDEEDDDQFDLASDMALNPFITEFPVPENASEFADMPAEKIYESIRDKKDKPNG